MVAPNNSANTTKVVWKPSDVSTFTQQSQNLGQQAQNAGINTSQQDVQAQTGAAQLKAGQSGQNVAAGASQVVSGAQVSPTMAQAPLNVSGGASPIIQPYQETASATTAPSATITSPSTLDSSLSTYNPNVQSYLSSLFPQGIPQSVLDSVNQGLSQNASGAYNPVSAATIGGVQPWQDQAAQDAYANPSTAPQIINQSGVAPQVASKLQLPSDFSNSGEVTSPNDNRITNNTTNTNSSLSTAFSNYLNSLQAGQQSAALQPDVQAQFQNFLQNQLAIGQQNLNTQYQTSQNNLSTENTNKQQGISDYIGGLNSNLQNYGNQFGDLSNVGQLSAAEQQVAAKNAVLTGQGALSGPTAGTEALGAVSNNGSLNSRFGVLSQQAQAGALQNAQSNAVQAQNSAVNGQNQLAAGQTAQSNALTQAGTDISTNQTNLLNKLNNNSTAAQQTLTSAYNDAGTNLNNQEQSFVNKAQDTLKQANVPESAIQTAVTGFASTIQNALSNNSLDDQDKANLINNLESIWRISVGTNPSDIKFSDTIAGILSPLIAQINNIKAVQNTTTKPTSTVTKPNTDPTRQGGKEGHDISTTNSPTKSNDRNGR